MVPQIYVHNIEKKISTNLVTSILVALQIHDVPVENLCGGRAKCGKCAIRVLNGMQYLSTIKPLEKQKLRQMNAGDDIRLACQTYSRGDVEIEIRNLRKLSE